ncbi:uncharacterized protein BJ212DRAFT_1479586 [Suillus subaureus]|uniref:Uncharacterized protein n=1 Tax=Suillus subaureus TaxID=48587 RepID=A0A9P7EE63_9AGAM|nr:uncharacterized protein BJ212DRAFT_1479586 [Suillus subaureus]KAG1818580.1 hypothetical protein BJ212DRAFT_1479586 [Suillus subaureus]
MSTPVDNSLTGLKASTAQIMAIISGAQQIPLGNSHFSLTTQAQVIKDYGSGPLPGIVLLCSKELLCIQGMTPQVWPNWHNIGYNDPCLLTHVWCPKFIAWEALGDHTFDLPVAAPPSTGPIPVDLPSPPICTGNVTSPSTSTTTEFWDKGKGKAVDADLEPKVEGSWKRKSPMILGLSSQPPKSAMKTHKHAKSSCWVMSKPLVDLEDKEDMGIQPLLGGVPEVILPWLSNLPRSPWVLTKKPFGPTTVIASSHPAVIEPSQLTPKSPVEAPPVIDGGDILIPGPVKQLMPGLHQAKVALRNSVGQEDWESMYVMRPLHNKEDQVHPSNYGYPTEMCSWVLYHPEHKVQDTLQGSLQSSPYLPIQGPDSQSVSCKTITAVKAPTPAPAPVPAPAPGPAVPAAALDLPMPDLHAMAIVIQDGTAYITILEAHVAEQDGKIDTLQCLHEGLRHKSSTGTPHSHFLNLQPMQHPCCLINPSPQPCHHPHLHSPLSLISQFGEMMPAPPKFEDASATEGLLFEYNWVVQPEL